MDLNSRIWLYLSLVVMMVSCTADENPPVSDLGLVNFVLDVQESPDAQSNQPFSLEMSMPGTAYSHKWEDIRAFSQYEAFYSGQYVAVAKSGSQLAEGFDCPCYRGQTEFEIMPNRKTDVSIKCELVQALVCVRFDENLRQVYANPIAVLHTIGHNYVEYHCDEMRSALVLPGKTNVYLSLTNDEGTAVTIDTGFAMNTRAASTHNVMVRLVDGDVIEITDGYNQSKLRISSDLFSSPRPSIMSYGFANGQTLNLIEGYPSSDPILMEINAQSGLKRVLMTIEGRFDDSVESISDEYDLIADPMRLIQEGLEIEQSSDQAMRIDFTNLLQRMIVRVNSDVKFYVTAIDRLGQMSEVCELKVEIRSLNMEVVSLTRAVIGEDMATVAVRCNTQDLEIGDFTLYTVDHNGEYTMPLPIRSYMLDSANSLLTLTFAVPAGISPQPVRIDYIDRPKIEFVVERQVPEYGISVDAFATQAFVQIEIVDADTRNIILKAAKVYVNGREGVVGYRDCERGILQIIGLQPSSSYTIMLDVIAGQYQAQSKCTTEEARQLPDGDFEDADVALSYHSLPMGGVYSTTVFPLYNTLNHTDCTIYWPKKFWASVNAKTFCRQARNHNTWYMQPSAECDFDNCASGSKSIKLTSVGWSLDGPEIEPYAQAQDSYLPYNPNVPEVAHRAAGKLFLGSYSFDAAIGVEKYTQGISFNSRPTSLNGYYKYLSVAGLMSDSGLVELRLINDELGTTQIIGHARMELTNSPDFRTFNVPIEYEQLGLKPTRLELMFSTSTGSGSIADEDMNVPTMPDLQNSAYRGSTLWIDNLTLTY